MRGYATIDKHPSQKIRSCIQYVLSSTEEKLVRAIVSSLFLQDLLPRIRLPTVGKLYKVLERSERPPD